MGAGMGLGGARACCRIFQPGQAFEEATSHFRKAPWQRCHQTITRLSNWALMQCTLYHVVQHGRDITMPTGNGQASFSEDLTPPSQEAHEEGAVGKAVAAVAVVAVGAALFEVALLPGIALGVAAVAAPKYLPKLGGAVNPPFKAHRRRHYKASQQAQG